MKSTKCYTTEQLAEYSLDMGNKVWRDRVEKHLSECSACRDELALLSDAGALMNKIPTQKAPDLWNNIAPNLTPRRQSFLHWIPMSGRPLYASLALGILVVLAVISAWFMPVRKSVPQQTAYKYEQLDSHSTMLWNDPFADRVSLVVYNAASDDKVVD